MPASCAEPTRPTNLPTNAVWDAQFNVWRVGENDENGRWQGQQFTYRSDGSLQGEYVYVAGKPNGRFRRYHPDGTLSVEGEYHLGAPVGTHTVYRSAAVNDEAVHTCCMPSNASKVLTHYPNDGRLLEEYYDAEGRRLLRDGSPHPEPPTTVPSSARFEPQQAAWVDGRYERAERHGCFHFWSPDGTLREVANYKHGQLDGLRERFVDERCVERRMYKAGQPEGCAWEQIAKERFEDIDIAAHEGFYERGKPVGKWRYLDATGQIVATVDIGPTVDEVALDDAVFRTVTPQDTLALDPAREHVRRVLYAAHHGDDAVFQAEVRRVPQLLAPVSEKIVRQLSNQPLEPAQHVARLLHWLMRGARAEHVFRALGTLLVREAAAGLRLLKVSLRLAPDELETRAAEILLLTALGKVRLARQRLEPLATTHPDAANELAFNLRVTFPEFDDWVARTPIGDEESPELPIETARDVPALRVALSKTAKRLGAVRDALSTYAEEVDSCEFALPPNLSHWSILEPTSLDHYTFDTAEDVDTAEDAEQPTEGDLVRVDERLDLVGYSLTELMMQARLEWTTLCWLRFAAGQVGPTTERAPLPTEFEPQPRFGKALTQAFRDLYRVKDQLETSGIRTRNQGLPDCTWEGCSVSRLGRNLLVQAFAEMRERRAALYYAADDTCRSVWQDDLRET